MRWTTALALLALGGCDHAHELMAHVVAHHEAPLWLDRLPVAPPAGAEAFSVAEDGDVVTLVFRAEGRPDTLGAWGDALQRAAGCASPVTTAKDGVVGVLCEDGGATRTVGLASDGGPTVVTVQLARSLWRDGP